MKKIFAIALALVMVLSMASAFASSWCRTDFDWSCATTVCDNGTGSVELIPYVKGNGCGNGNLYTVSKCAGAVNGDKIYFAIKLTVDANPSEEWWNVAKLSFSTVKGVIGLTNNGVLPSTVGELTGLIKAANSGEFKAGEYYLTINKANNWELVKAADFDQPETGSEGKTLFVATVNNASKAKVCVKLASENKFNSSKIGDYTIEMINGRLHITKKNYSAIVTFDGDDKVKSIHVAHKKDDGTWETDGEWTKYVADNGSAFVSDVPEYAGYSCNDGAFLKGVLDTFKFTFGTCMTKKAINANFGWDNSSESCFQWNKDVLAVVNSECQVAIPKTGDVSVVAYAVMALVAAAGAMGLKK